MNGATFVGAFAIETKSVAAAAMAAMKAARYRRSTYGYVLVGGSRVRWARVEHWRLFGFDAPQVSA